MDITTRNLRTWLEGSGEHIVVRLNFIPKNEKPGGV